jgi:hypothetical protein
MLFLRLYHTIYYFIMKYYLTLIAFVFLVACSKPTETVVPTDVDKISSIQPQLEKLSPEQKELFRRYLSDHPDIPEGITIGKAIDEEREYLKKSELELKNLQEQLKSLRENWQFKLVVDKFTDEKKAFASIRASEADEKGFISVGCFPTGIEVKVSAGEYIGDSRTAFANVRYRVDSNLAVTIKMKPTSDKFVYENDKNSKFLSALVSGRKIIVELTNYNFETSSASFSLNGAEEQIRKVLTLCSDKI